MKSYTGVAAHALPDPRAPDFTARLRDMIATIDVWARDASFGFGRIERGETPSGSGASIGVTDHGLLSGLGDDDHLQYLLLDPASLGRTTGQAITDHLTVTSDASASIPLTLVGGSSEATSVQKWQTSAAASTLDLFMLTGGIGPAASLRTNVGVGLFLTRGGTANGINILASGTQIIGGKLAVVGALSLASLFSVDAAAAAAVVADSDANVFIVRRSANQTGHAIDYREQTRATTLFLVRADGHHYSAVGSSDLTAQTGSIGATTLLTGAASGTAGMYRVSVYLKTTTAGNPGDVVLVTVAYNDGAAQTKVIPLLTSAAVAANHDLGTLNAHAQGSIVLNLAASQNITYTTTVTAAGSPQYSIGVRTEALG